MSLLRGLQGAIGGAVVGVVVGVVTGKWQSAKPVVRRARTGAVAHILSLGLRADTEDAVRMLGGLVPGHTALIHKLAQGLSELEHLAAAPPRRGPPRAVLGRSTAAHAAARNARDAILELEVAQDTATAIFTTQADILESVIAENLFNVNIATSV